MKKIIILLLMILLVGCSKEPLNVEVNTTTPTNYKLTDGDISILITGGKTPYRIEVNDAVIEGNTFECGIGTYKVLVTDAEQETYLKSFELQAPLEVSINSKDSTAYNKADGEISVECFAGKAPYNITVNDTLIEGTVFTARAGVYDVKVIDANDNIYFESITLKAPFTVTSKKSQWVKDNQRYGQVSIKPKGGIEPYQISVNDIIVDKIPVLEAGKHTIVISDSNGNQEVINMTIEKLITDTITDHDGNEYNIVKIGEQWWMAENLKMKTNYDGSSIESLYFLDDENYAELGNLYSYESAMKIKLDGWHLPTHDDFKKLELYLGMSETDANKIGSSDRGNIGARLKASGDTGFNVTLDGWYGGSEHGYGGLKEGIAFLTSDLYNEQVIIRTFMRSDKRIFCYPDPLDWKFYVRLVKND